MNCFIWIPLWTHQMDEDKEHFHNPEGSFRPASNQNLPVESTVLTSIAIDSFFLFLNLCIWLIPLRTMSLKFLHLWLAAVVNQLYHICHHLCVCFPAGTLGLFAVWGYYNQAVMNILKSLGGICMFFSVAAPYFSCQVIGKACIKL